MPSKAAQVEVRRVDTHEEEHAGESYAANADFGMPAAIGMFYRRREALSVVLANICREASSPPLTATSSAGKVGGRFYQTSTLGLMLRNWIV